MREVFLDPVAGQRSAASVQVAVEQDGHGARVLIRMGGGRWRSLSGKRSRDLAMVLVTAAAEAEALDSHELMPS